MCNFLTHAVPTAIRNDYDRARALADLAPHMPKTLEGIASVVR